MPLTLIRALLNVSLLPPPRDQGWVEIMYRSSLVSFDFPRPEDSINLAARALKKYKNASLTLAMREEGLQEAKRYLPGCVRGDEIRSLQKLGVLKCTAVSFTEEIEVPCESTCGTNLTKFVIPAFK